MHFKLRFILIIAIFPLAYGIAQTDSYRNSVFEAGEKDAVQVQQQPDPVQNSSSDDEGGSGEVTGGTRLTTPTFRPPRLRPRTSKKKPKGGQRKPKKKTTKKKANFSRISRKISSAPIWNKFKTMFAACAPGCAPYGIGTWRPRNTKFSCHNGGHAVDMFGFKCGGKKFSAYTSRYAKFVRCAKRQKYRGRRWKTIYRQTGGKRHCRNSPSKKTVCHWDHAHFSLGCRKPNGRGYY